jgi:hypothetical protein
MAVILNGAPNVVLMHLAPIVGPGAVTDCTLVTLLAPFLDIVSYLQSVVPLPDLIQGLVDIQVTS